MERYICIHGHFYQPPRENPWLEAVELQDTASPYHDWNEKITAECYAPNAASRILDDRGRIVEIVNNYSRISFNFGPTLLTWLEKNTPEVYSAILEADAESIKRFSGHGSALAQTYNHMIMPLASRRDKYTQALWGVCDFRARFGRPPEGMWLPETAADLETLDILSETGVSFAILAPHQARRVRPLSSKEWRDVSGGNVDPTRAYALRLPSGRKIALFFYDGPISNAVAFEGLLNRGETFAQRLLSGFTEARDWPQLMHVATDGESYGHHHRFGDMALAYALHHIESNALARLTNYGEYLEKHPPDYEAEIFEDTSWSCVHGVERWRSGCGCRSGGHPDWNQEWRRPLREALDWLRDAASAGCERACRTLLKDLWKSRNDYIEVVLDRSSEKVDTFLARHSARVLNGRERTDALKLMELQRYAMLMYTSCGWFFDELSGIETVQVLHYAGRVLQLAREALGEDLEGPFLKRLEAAKSNLRRYGDGRRIFERLVTPSAVDLEKVGAHYAMSSLFEDYSEETDVYCYRVRQKQCETFEAGISRLVVGDVDIASAITGESDRIFFGALYFGDHNLTCGVSKGRENASYPQLVRELSDPFRKGDIPETIRMLDKRFSGPAYSFRSLFRDEQRKILYLMLNATLEEAEGVYRQLYENHAPLMRYLRDLSIPGPQALYAAAQVFLNSALRQAFSREEPDPELIGSYLEEAAAEDISLDAELLEHTLRKSMEGLFERFLAAPEEIGLVRKLDDLSALASNLPFPLNLRKMQNIFYHMIDADLPAFLERTRRGDETAQEWVNHFLSLGEKLSVRVGSKDG